MESFMDSITALDTRKSYNSVPCQEYFLQGSILVEYVDYLVAILQGLCDDFEETIHTFKDREIRYQYVADNLTGWPLELRVRRSLLDDDVCTVRYVGRTECGDASQPTAVRTSIDVGVTGDVDEFLTYSGFRKSFDYFASGYMFRKGRMKITISRIMKGERKPDHFLTESCLVETSIVERAGVWDAGFEMRQFTDGLRPIVEMIKPE